MKISLIHPSRNRPDKSEKTIMRWFDCSTCSVDEWYELIVSVDKNDPGLEDYLQIYDKGSIIVNENRSCVDAINNAAKVATGDIFVVVSDDTDCFPGWDTALLKDLEGKSDYLLKTDDGIQDYIVTQTIMDRKYYERDGFVYHPDFIHQFADTYLTCLADIRGRLIYSKLKFPHLHYSHSAGKEEADALHKRNNETWQDGENAFVRLMKQFSKEELNRIKNPGMRGFLKSRGI